jgi:hypothetical protein
LLCLLVLAYKSVSWLFCPEALCLLLPIINHWLCLFLLHVWLMCLQWLLCCCKGSTLSTPNSTSTSSSQLEGTLGKEMTCIG